MDVSGHSDCNSLLIFAHRYAKKLDGAFICSHILVCKVHVQSDTITSSVFASPTCFVRRRIKVIGLQLLDLKKSWDNRKDHIRKIQESAFKCYATASSLLRCISPHGAHTSANGRSIDSISPYRNARMILTGTEALPNGWETTLTRVRYRKTITSQGIAANHMYIKVPHAWTGLEKITSFISWRVSTMSCNQITIHAELSTSTWNKHDAVCVVAKGMVQSDKIR